MEEHLMKILIVGNTSVGKSAFVHRYVKGKFNKTYKMTVGVEFSVKVLKWSEKEQVRLQLWDIAGLERFISMTRVYYKGALGCVVMFDVTNTSSFLNCRSWKQDLDNKALLPNGDSIPCILLANKCDLPERAVSADSIDEFSKANGFVTWMETSVKENQNVAESMSGSKRRPQQSPRTRASNLHNDRHPRESMKSWTAPGPDMIHTYWLKKLPTLQEHLAAQTNQLLMDGMHQDWLTQGPTVLIMKDPQKGTIPSNYQPITFLCTTWKLLSGIIAAKMNRHMAQYMSWAQKGISSNTKGAKHKLLVDRAETGAGDFVSSVLSGRTPYPTSSHSKSSTGLRARQQQGERLLLKLHLNPKQETSKHSKDLNFDLQVV
ncbi:ras-related protein Rab-7L1-like [Scomber scombrus]|uniref:Ras-related protein Rab n=1 Tax=Scomber scombrus TaxID=13677 RepID=A0AAV1PY70_SCOSC